MTNDSRQPIVSLCGLRKSYRRGWFGRQREALRGVDLDVAPGQVFGLLGPNGAGKTTLVKVLLGIVRNWTGEVRILGGAAGSTEVRRRIGYLPENLRLASHHTARSALKHYGRLAGLDGLTIERRSAELLEMVGLADRQKEPVTRYSKGMVQRLGVAQAMLHDPDLLILDEPTDGLDPVGRADVRNLLRRLGESGKTVFLNSHILQEVEMVCDRVAVLVEGKVRVSGSLAEIADSLTKNERVSVIVNSDDLSLIRTTLKLSDDHPLVVSSHRQTRIELQASDQQMVDDYVDRIRTAGISLVGLQMLRPSLEELFLSVVGPSN